MAVHPLRFVAGVCNISTDLVGGYKNLRYDVWVHFTKAKLALKHLEAVQRAAPINRPDVEVIKKQLTLVEK